MKIMPFGEVLEDRLELSKRYGLLEMVGGLWRLTSKAKQYYDSVTYVYYLQGKVEKPSRLIKEKLTPSLQEAERKECQRLIDEILSM